MGNSQAAMQAFAQVRARDEHFMDKMDVYAEVCERECVCVRVRACVRACVRERERVRVCLYVCLFVCMYVCMCVCA